MGTFVNQADIPNSHCSPSSMRTQILDLFNTAQTLTTEANTELKTALAAFDVDLADFTLPDDPVAPIEPTLSFSWQKTDYSSDVYTALWSKINYELTNYRGMSEEVYDASVARELRARKANQQREHRRLIDATGASGFNLASGAIAGIEREVSRAILEQDQNALDAIRIKDFDLAVRAKEFAITSAAQLESMIREAYVQSESISLEAAKGVTEHLVSVYQASVNAFEAKWKGLEVSVQSQIAEAGLKEKMVEALASVLVQKLASALGMINASMSHGYSGSESESIGHSYSQSVNNSLNEGHNYTEV